MKMTARVLKQIYTRLRYGLGSIIAAGFILLPFYLIFFMQVTRGFHIGALIWSFFVLCLPFAFASSIFSLPYWLATGKSFLYSEVTAWICAIGINLYTFLNCPELYLRFATTHALYRIITHPMPYWLIIAVNLGITLFRTFGGPTVKKTSYLLYYALNTLFMAISFLIMYHLIYHELVIILNIQS